jgi:hypothetical protein
VLNNSESVKAKNRERVLKAIAESNYQPNLLARQLRTARSSMILVLVSNIANPFCAEVVKGIEEEAEKTVFVSCCAIPVRTWSARARHSTCFPGKSSTASSPWTPPRACRNWRRLSAAPLGAVRGICR